MLDLILTLYLSGLPLAAVWLVWAFRDIPGDELDDFFTLHGVLAFALFLALWPVVMVAMLVVILKDRV